MIVGTIASLQSVAQEAMETADQTKAEAAKGDQEAVRRLAAVAQAANNAQGAQQPAESTKGGLDLLA